MKIALARHPAPLIAPGICYGRLDIPLKADAGEIRRLAADPAFLRMNRVWTSPARRCLALARAIGAVLTTEPIIDPRLWELDFGDWEGKPWDAIDRSELDSWAAAPLSFVPPGGETGAALIDRVRALHDDLRRRGEDCVVVSHGGPLKLLSAMLNEAPVDLLAPAPPIGSVTVIECPASIRET